MLRVVVFSDVDGVFDHPSRAAVRAAATVLGGIADLPVSIVLCSMKSRAEIEMIQQQLRICEPFIAEGGSAIFIPTGYFPGTWMSGRTRAGYALVEFAAPYADVSRTLATTARQLDIAITALRDMSVEEVASLTGLPLLKARLTKLREYVELFRFDDSASPPARERLIRGLQAARLRCLPYWPFHAVGSATPQGAAVAALRRLYVRTFGTVHTVGFADSGATLDHLPTMDTKVMVEDDDASPGGVDVAVWALAIVDTTRDVLARMAAPRAATRAPRSRRAW
jgi:mannosyl-3-phosphoglycerate phosphatase